MLVLAGLCMQEYIALSFLLWSLYNNFYSMQRNLHNIFRGQKSKRGYDRNLQDNQREREGNTEKFFQLVPDSEGPGVRDKTILKQHAKKDAIPYFSHKGFIIDGIA